MALCAFEVVRFLLVLLEFDGLDGPAEYSKGIVANTAATKTLGSSRVPAFPDFLAGQLVARRAPRWRTDLPAFRRGTPFLRS
jgi:hypothetical protein